MKKFDARVLTLDSEPETYYTLEKKPLIVDSFVKWKVSEVQKFYERASFEIERAQRLLQERSLHQRGYRGQVHVLFQKNFALRPASGFDFP